MYSTVYQRASPGLFALWCGLDQKRSSDQKEARAGLNPTAKVTIHSIIHQAPMLKPGSIKREKRGRERDREIDLEERLPFFTCPPTETSVSSFCDSKSPGSPVAKKQRKQVEWRRWRGGSAPSSCVFRPLYLKDPRSWLSHRSPVFYHRHRRPAEIEDQNRKWNKIWHLQCHLDVGGLTAPLRSKTLDHWPRWVELPRTQRIFIGSRLLCNALVPCPTTSSSSSRSTPHNHCIISHLSCEASTCFSLSRREKELKNTKLEIGWRKNTFPVQSKYDWGPCCTFCSAIVLPTEHIGCSCSSLFYFILFYFIL